MDSLITTIQADPQLKQLLDSELALISKSDVALVRVLRACTSCSSLAAQHSTKIPLQQEGRLAGVCCMCVCCSMHLLTLTSLGIWASLKAVLVIQM